MDINDLVDLFPNLEETGFRKTSDPDPYYNCIAWAAHDTGNWWWPDEDSYWPESVPREETIEAFIAAYRTCGYIPCDDGTLEDEYEKVAVYANEEGPKHAARQLPDGKWTSKLGKLDDIEHNTLEGINSTIYGAAVNFLKRPRVASV